MDRDFDHDGRDPQALPRADLKRSLYRPPAPDARDRNALSRDHRLLTLRDSTYRLSDAELATLYDIGRFRTVAIEDLGRHRYQGNTAVMRQDLRALAAQGLLHVRTIWTGPRRRALPVAVLTPAGKEILDRHRPAGLGQTIYARLVKPAEVRHDAAIYRMFQAERQKIERAGGQIRRVILDYELKRRVYRPLAKAKALPVEDYARRQHEVAREHGLAVINGKIPLPDLRVEYETPSGELARVDLELATTHYHGPALQAKAQAGFKFYAADGSAARLSRVLEQRDITVEILSL